MPQTDIVHLAITVVSDGLILCLFISAILTWLPIQPGHPVVRFFNNIVSPVLDPIRHRVPRLSVGMFDLSATLAFILAWWAIELVATLLTQALPPGV